MTRFLATILPVICNVSNCADVLEESGHFAPGQAEYELGHLIRFAFFDHTGHHIQLRGEYRWVSGRTSVLRCSYCGVEVVGFTTTSFAALSQEQAL